MKPRKPSILLLAALAAVMSAPLPSQGHETGTHATDDPAATEEQAPPREQSGELAPVVIEGRAEKLIGVAESASQGTVGHVELESRPVSRAAEVLEVIPGFIATQHSGSGKANQYFVRGFNLDHGSDFSARVEGVPANMPTHAHGQGYLDLNFVIPELVRAVRFRKGPYFAEVGDFASAGSADLDLFETLERGIFETSVGEDGFARFVLADSFKTGENGNLLLGGEVLAYDGPWQRDENFAKYNALMRYTWKEGGRGASLDATAYRASWDATDQIPARAVRDGRLGRLGLIDDSDGGNTERYSLSGSAWRSSAHSRTKAQAYGLYYALDLFSNFTYFLEDPVSGDQFHQRDRRGVFGGEVTHEMFGEILSVPHETRVGLQLRHDHIPSVALSRTRDREQVRGIREDNVEETAVGVWADTTLTLTPWLRTILGLRGDGYRFGVDSDLDANSGTELDGIVSPKAGLVLGPWRQTEVYGNAGMGFHSNDARGTTIRLDPASDDLDDPTDMLDPAEPVDPLVRSRGAEVGVRTEAIDGLFSSVSLWWLDLASELVFVGDAGNTEAGGPSRRYGIEWANFYQPIPRVTFDFDLSYTWARFRSTPDNADEIPGSIPLVIAAGVTGDIWRGIYGALRLRYLGSYPLIEDGSEDSDSTTLVNLRTGYRTPDEQFGVALDVLNLFDSRDRDIAYYYESDLGNDPAEGIHFHPVEPRTLRLTFTWRF